MTDTEDPAVPALVREITEPGIYPDLTADDYHRDPWRPGGSLSSTGARKLLRSPATYRYGEDESTRRMDFGTASHAQVLGAGAEVVLVDRDRWDTSAVKEQVAEIRARGGVPVKRAEYERIKAMTAKLAEHKSAAELFAGDSGQAEQALFWVDDEFGVPCRALVDFLPYGAGGRVACPDYKTAESAAPAAVAKAIANYGYHVQGAHYCAGIEALRPGVEARFVLVIQEIKPPYLVAVYQFGHDTIEEGRRGMREALEKYRDCRQAGVWPGYDPSEGITTIDIPRWGYRYGDDW